jgi:hypothetical protein
MYCLPFCTLVLPTFHLYTVRCPVHILLFPISILFSFFRFSLLSVSLFFPPSFYIHIHIYPCLIQYFPLSRASSLLSSEAKSKNIFGGAKLGKNIRHHDEKTILPIKLDVKVPYPKLGIFTSNSQWSIYVIVLVDEDKRNLSFSFGKQNLLHYFCICRA